MVARGLFELAVDTKLIDAIPDAVEKILAFSDVEKLRAARKIVKYKAANPAAAVDATIHGAFITSEEARIEAERNTVWPGLKRVTHWSGMDLSKRVALLQAPFDEIYEVGYPELSWYVHSGLTGFVNLQAESQIGDGGDKFLASLVASQPVAERLSIRCHVMAEALRNDEPDGIRRKRQWAVLAEGEMHGVDQRMAMANGTVGWISIESGAHFRLQ
jgi:hypothetical protein